MENSSWGEGERESYLNVKDGKIQVAFRINYHNSKKTKTKKPPKNPLRMNTLGNKKDVPMMSDIQHLTREEKEEYLVKNVSNRGK